MTDSRDEREPPADAVHAGCDRLDVAIRAYNRHAILAERYRMLHEQFTRARRSWQRAVASHGTRLADVRRDAAERERWREARAGAAAHREELRLGVHELVRLLRDGGMPPDRVLDFVKDRLAKCATPDAPGAPTHDARVLEEATRAWAIAAYFEAA